MCFGCSPEEFGAPIVDEYASFGKIVQATRREGDAFVPLEGQYLVLAPRHITDLADWGSSQRALLWARALLGVNDKPHNLSMNIGEVAGQTLDHLHWWIIVRSPTTASAGKGLSILIQEADARP